ncbi:MAG: hypothetical protein DCC49_13690 [Acidobacteria bacterium]|nr:MAG: hypothetical protein DCC49_13690 [Acidobacteriota bacterium]
MPLGATRDTLWADLGILILAAISGFMSIYVVAVAIDQGAWRHSYSAYDIDVPIGGWALAALGAATIPACIAALRGSKIATRSCELSSGIGLSAVVYLGYLTHSSPDLLGFELGLAMTAYAVSLPALLVGSFRRRGSTSDSEKGPVISDSWAHAIARITLAAMGGVLVFWASVAEVSRFEGTTVARLEILCFYLAGGALISAALLAKPGYRGFLAGGLILLFVVGIAGLTAVVLTSSQCALFERVPSRCPIGATQAGDWGAGTTGQGFVFGRAFFFVIFGTAFVLAALNSILRSTLHRSPR